MHLLATQANPIMVFYPLQREVSLEDTKVYQLPSLFMSTLLHNLNYSIEIESSKDGWDGW